MCSSRCRTAAKRRRDRDQREADHAEATAKLLAGLDAGKAVVVNRSRRGPHAHLLDDLEASGRLVGVHRPIRGKQRTESRWANPYLLADPDDDAERTRVIAAYRDHLNQHPELLAQISDLRGKALGCFCWPRPCHGDVLAALANAEAG